MASKTTSLIFVKSINKITCSSKSCKLHDLPQRVKDMELFIFSHLGYCLLIRMSLKNIYKQLCRSSTLIASKNYPPRRKITNLLKKNNSLSIHQRNSQILTTRKKGFNPQIMFDISLLFESLFCM